MRSSNIELLRILAMLMVVNLHTSFMPEELSLDTLTPVIGLDFFRESTSISSVNLFVLISGYFSIKWKYKSFASLIFQVFFWVFLIYGLLLVVGIIDFNLKDFIFRINCLATAYWFVTAYIGLYLLAPIFNGFAEASVIGGGKKLLQFIALFYLLQFYYQPFGNLNFTNGYTILSLSGVYMLGRYIRLTDLSLSRSKTLWGILITTLFITLSAIMGVFIGKNLFIYNNPFVVAQTVFIFLYFKGLNIQSKVINYCASSALAIYLFHMHPDIKQHFYAYAQSLYTYSIFMHFIMLIVIFVIVFAFAIIVDKVRLRLFEFLYTKFEVYLTNWRNGRNSKIYS